MDPTSIATVAVAFLAPYLAEGGKAAAKKAGEALVAALERRFKGQPAPQTALDDLRADPKDEDNQAALRKELKKALAADPEFLTELAQLLQEAETVTTGARPVIVGGDVKDSVIVTGDGNVVEKR